MNTENLSFKLLAISLLVLSAAISAIEKRTTLPPKLYDFVQNPQSPVVIVHRAEPVAKKESIKPAEEDSQSSITTRDHLDALLTGLDALSPKLKSIIATYKSSNNPKLVQSRSDFTNEKLQIIRDTNETSSLPERFFKQSANKATARVCGKVTCATAGFKGTNEKFERLVQSLANGDPEASATFTVQEHCVENPK
jgi:hypothetical protein